MDQGDLNSKKRPSRGLHDFVASFFKETLGDQQGGLTWHYLKGDGSDRFFYRVKGEGLSVVAMAYPNLRIRLNEV